MAFFRVAAGLMGAATAAVAYEIFRDSDDPREQLVAGTIGVIAGSRAIKHLTEEVVARADNYRAQLPHRRT